MLFLIFFTTIKIIVAITSIGTHYNQVPIYIIDFFSTQCGCGGRKALPVDSVLQNTINAIHTIRIHKAFVFLGTFIWREDNCVAYTVHHSRRYCFSSVKYLSNYYTLNKNTFPTRTVLMLPIRKSSRRFGSTTIIIYFLML